MYHIKGQLINVFHQEERVNQRTGEMMPAADYIQVLGKVPRRDGGFEYQTVRLKVEDLTPYKALLGKEISLPVQFMARENRAFPFVPKGSRPELAQSVKAAA